MHAIGSFQQVKSRPIKTLLLSTNLPSLICQMHGVRFRSAIWI